MRLPTLLNAALTLPNGQSIANRIAKAAMTEGLADTSAYPSPALERLYAKWAHSGCGVLITGNVMIDRQHLERPGNVVIDRIPDADMRTSLSAWAHAAQSGGAKIWMQVNHAGRQTQVTINPHPKAPSAIKLGLPGKKFGVPQALTEAEILELVERFANAALVARDTGFDGVQIHAAHGYLLSQFLSPRFNRRRDGYGGGVERRARLLLEVVEAVRAAVGPNYPVLVKINAEDFVPGGLSVDDMLAVVELLEAAGCDAVELSGGTGSPEGISFSRVGRPAPGEPEAYYESAARRFKKSVDMPLILVGGIRTFETATRLVAEGVTDYLALSRPLIREPDLVARWRSGDTRPARCVSDNACFDSPDDGHGLFCIVEARRK